MNPSINHEHTLIEFALMAYPCHISITDDSSPYYNNFDKNLAIEQYNQLINLLINQGYKVNFIPLNGGTSQVFTRDIGFPIGDLLFIANLSEESRKKDIRPLLDYASSNKLNNLYIMQEKIEGGDVFVHGNKLFIGTGGRTTQLAVEELQNKLKSINKEFTVIKVLFDLSKIHLDCVFNILDEETCIITNGVFNRDEVTKHFSRVIEVPPSDVDSLAANIINLGNNRILCSNEGFTKILQNFGYESTFINFSEIEKLGGSLGCSILPIIRS